ncbi:MAG: (2Fe-2S)-binding protein [Melioribacteraceae bacterium]|nr:(2Fe-2S)-binding protein [Melioribacteraceae bacterium]
MSNEENKKGISRRKFLKGTGAGVIGSSILISNLAKADEKNEQLEKDVDSKSIHSISLTVNGKKVNAKVKANTTLVQFIRDELKLTGTKAACNEGQCGSCTVIVNNQAVYSCHMLAVDANNKEIITIEGLMNGEEINPLQEAFKEKDGLQCGFCSPGQIMAAHALLLRNKKPTKAEIKEAMAGNLCRCGAYPHIIESVFEAAKN